MQVQLQSTNSVHVATLFRELHRQDFKRAYFFVVNLSLENAREDCQNINVAGSKVVQQVQVWTCYPVLLALFG